MANDHIADGSVSKSGSSLKPDMVERLSQVSNRTSLMVIDATLRALPKDAQGFVQAQAEVGAIAGRMLRATQDFAASLACVPDTTS